MPTSLVKRKKSKPKTNINRSRVTTGRSLFLTGSCDGRSAVGRRFRDLFELHQSDIGGEDVVTEAQRQLCRRAAALGVWCEEIESHLVGGQPIDIDEYLKVTNSLRRVLDTIGVKSQTSTHNVTPTLDKYIQTTFKAAETVRDASD